jgi:hypothetical protein
MRLFTTTNWNGDFLKINPMQSPSGKVYYLDLVYNDRVFYLNEELWWEDDSDGRLYCPQIIGDDIIGEYEFKAMRDRELIIPDWEIRQMKYLEKHNNTGELLNDVIDFFKKVEKKLIFDY